MDDLSSRAAACDVKGADPERVALARTGLLDDEAYARLAELFRTLADSSRAKIVHSLLKQELCTCDLAAITGLSEPAVSQHLRLLRALQLVKTRREGKMVFYSLADAHVRFLLSVTLEHLEHEEAVTPPPRPSTVPPLHSVERGSGGEGEAVAQNARAATRAAPTSQADRHRPPFPHRERGQGTRQTPSARQSSNPTFPEER